MTLSVTGISKSFGSTMALDRVDFAVRAGEVHALLGENGSGKSTLMRILHGEVQADAGVMQRNGEGYAPSKPADAMRRGVALVHQELAICDHLSVVENIFLGSEIHRFGSLQKAEMYQIAWESLSQLGHPEIDVNALAGSLSSAQKQILEIARALRSGAEVILFDEPTSSLGHHDVESLFHVIRKLKDQGKAVVYITHFLDEVMTICDRVTVLRDGSVAGTVEVSESSPSQMAAMMTGREVSELYFRSQRDIGESVLVGDSVSTGTSQIGVSLEIRRGEVLGVAGLVGAGRTELARGLFGLDRLKSGSVFVFGELARLSPANQWRKGLGFVSEDRKGEGVSLNLSISENIMLPVLSGVLVSKIEEATQSEEFVRQLGIKCRTTSQRVGTLSGGNQQKVALARLIAAKSVILILDEPTRGIDIGAKSEIYRMINQLANDGKSILLISSHLPELVGLCDRILVMRRGELVGEFDAHTITESELLEVCAGA